MSWAGFHRTQQNHVAGVISPPFSANSVPTTLQLPEKMPLSLCNAIALAICGDNAASKPFVNGGNTLKHSTVWGILHSATFWSPELHSVDLQCLLQANFFSKCSTDNYSYKWRWHLLARLLGHFLRERQAEKINILSMVFSLSFNKATEPWLNNIIPIQRKIDKWSSRRDPHNSHLTFLLKLTKLEDRASSVPFMLVETFIPTRHITDTFYLKVDGVYTGQWSNVTQFSLL